MCIRVRFTPRADIQDPWDAARQEILIPRELAATTLFTLRAVRAVLLELDIPQDHFGARCWCGEPIWLRPFVPQPRKGNEVILGA